MTEQTPQNIAEQIANAAVAQAAQIPVEQVQAAMNGARMPQNVPQGAQTAQPTQQTQAQPMARTQTNQGSQPVQTNYQVAQAPGIQQIIDQQNAQIAALMAQNAALNSQVVSLVQNGGQLTGTQMPQAQAPQQPNPQYPTQVQQMAQLGAQPDPFAGMAPSSLSSTGDYSLEGLASEIGKSEEKK